MITGKLYNFPYWGWGNPLDDLVRIHRELNRSLNDLTHYSPQSNFAGVFPLVNVFEDKDGYVIYAELPGLSSEDLEITAEGQSLTITGERKISPKGEDARFHRRERQAGTFNRAIALPNELNTEKIKARVKDGILTIHAPKAEAVKPKTIKIN